MISASDFTKLNEIRNEYLRLSDLVTYEEVLEDKKMYLHIEKQRQSLQKLALKFDEYLKTKHDLDEITAMSDDIFKGEKVDIEKNLMSLESQMVAMLKMFGGVLQSVSVEISDKVKSDSFSLREFLKTAYLLFCKNNALNVQVVTSDDSDTLNISGLNAEKCFSAVAGVHCYKTERTEYLANVFLFKKTDDIQFDEKDVRVTTMRSSGAGGQHINTTDSAIRAVHIPSGISVVCQDERSQFQNKQKALNSLAERVKSHYEKIDCDEKNAQRKKQMAKNKTGVFTRVYIEQKDVVIAGEEQVATITDFKKGNII